jgi:hypothetical protein
MKVQLNIIPFLGACLAFIIAYMTITSKIDQWIHFAGELNAMAFFFTSLLLGFMGLFTAIEPIKSK